MPRVSTKTTDDSPKPAPRKRAVRRVLPKDGDAPAPRKRAPRKTVSSVREDAVADAPVRRAPTGFAEAASVKSKSRRTYFSVAAVCLVVFGIAAGIGFTDDGQINVNARIEAEGKRQLQATNDTNPEAGEGTVTVPVQNTPPAAISGLKGRGVGTPDVVTEVVPDPTASSTEEVASSTPDTTDSEEVVESETTETSLE